jgi:hypothetical protein
VAKLAISRVANGWAIPSCPQPALASSAVHKSRSRRNDGQAAITRAIAAGSATATFAARLATLPMTSSAYGGVPPLPPDRDSASSVVDAATIIPSTERGVSAATQPG